jgi:P4 family phage/plasmid primase-like protien
VTYRLRGFIYSKPGPQATVPGTTVDLDWSEDALDAQFPLHSPKSKDDTYLWSASKLLPGKTRAHENVDELYAVVLDKDCGDVGELVHVTNHLIKRGQACWLHSAWSHRDEKKEHESGQRGPFDSFRVVLPCSRPVLRDEYHSLVAGVMFDSVVPPDPAKYKAEVVGRLVTLPSGKTRPARPRGWDPAMFKAAQPWYVPACPERLAKHAEFGVYQGDLLDVDRLVAIGRTVSDEKVRVNHGDGAPTGSTEAKFWAISEALDKAGFGFHSPVPDSENRTTCPSCQDPSPSLCIRAAADRIRVNCHACGDTPSIMSALDLPMGALFSDEATAVWKAEQEVKRTFAGGHYELTDSGNAQRMVDMYGENLRYVAEWKKWLVWDGKRWDMSSDGAPAMRLAYQSVQAIRDAARALIEQGNDDLAKKVRAYAEAAESSYSLRSCVTLAATLPEVRINFESLDNDEWLFNVQNGTIDLRTGVLRPHRQADLITKISPIDYDPCAVAPTWERFVGEIMCSSQPMVDYLQRWTGYMLTGSVREQAVMFNRGDGGNGKGTFFARLQFIWGKYAVMCESDLLLKSQNSKHSTGLTDLFRARLAVASETEEGRSWDEPLLKRLTGGDLITARRMREDNWTFTPTHKIAVQANSEPLVRSTDDGVWRRMHVVPFDASFRGKPDRMLETRLVGESEGILAWAVRGCLAWQRLGLAAPEAVTKATNAYRASQDTFAQFVADCCYVHPEVRITRGELREAYMAWCTAQGDYALPSKQFASRMRSIGLHEAKVKRDHAGTYERGWLGIRIAKTEAEQKGFHVVKGEIK